MKKLYKINAAHELQAFIDFLLTKTAVEKKDFSGTLILPHSAVLKKDDKLKDSRIVVKIDMYWDGDLKDAERSRDTKITN